MINKNFYILSTQRTTEAMALFFLFQAPVIHS